ncbi:MAG: hypothetical protein HQ541_01965, partial [Mariniphaga sp.]|nr:hypothetical protein [Mariniphaga sp.]
MSLWLAEIKDLKKIYESVRGKLPGLEKELERLIGTDDENMLLVYSRRCLEVIVTWLCEQELKRQRGTEPLQRIIDKLNKEGKVPHNIVVSMLNVNSMSTFGAHPKEFETEQVKPVLHNLKTIIKWYLDYLLNQESVIDESGTSREKGKEPVNSTEGKSKSGKKIILLAGLLLVVAIIIVALTQYDFIGKLKNAKAESIGSIIVLPISNITGMDSLEWLVDGMQASLIQDMGRVSGLDIRGTTTSRTFKDSNKTINEITSECNTDAALEMDLLCIGEDSLCLQTRLIESGSEEKEIWTADYKIARNKIQNWYNGVTKQIAKEVNVELSPDEEKLLSKSRIVDKEVYDAYLKSYQYWNDYSLESLNKAREFLNSAIEKDSTWAPLYLGLAHVWMGIIQMGFESPDIAIPKMYKNLNKALELNPDLSAALGLRALIAHVVEWDWEKSEKEYVKALAVNPNDALSRGLYAQLLCVLQKTDEALSQGRLALDLDPLNPNVKGLYASILICGGDCKTALDLAEEITASEPGNYMANYVILFAAFKCKEYDKVIKAEKYLLPVYNVKEDDIKEIEMIFNEQGFIKAYEK